MTCAMKFTVSEFAGKLGCAPLSFDSELAGQQSTIVLTELAENVQFKPAKTVAFTQARLADHHTVRWQSLIHGALANSNLVESSHNAPLLMIMPYVDDKLTQLKGQLITSLIEILPAWTAHPNTHYYLLGSAGFFQALCRADVLLSEGMEQVVIGAVDSWATEQGLIKFVNKFTDYSSVVLPASEGAVFVVLSRQSQGIEVDGCRMDAVVDRHRPNGLIAIIDNIMSKQNGPMQYLTFCHSGDDGLDQVTHNTMSAISGLYDANTQYLTPQITQGDIGACYSLLNFLISYHQYKLNIWSGNCLQIDTSSLPYVGAAMYHWFD